LKKILTFSAVKLKELLTAEIQTTNLGFKLGFNERELTVCDVFAQKTKHTYIGEKCAFNLINVSLR
jgi:hypothetical protein